MTNMKCQRILAILLALAMLMSMTLVFTISGSAESQGKSYTLNAASLTVFDPGMKGDGDYQRAGTDDFFTVFYSAKAKIENDTNGKSFEDGFNGTRRFAWGAKTEFGDQILNAIKIKTKGSATVKLWWVCGGENRYPAIFNESGSALSTAKIPSNHVNEGTDGIKNDIFFTEFKLSSQGIYYIGNLGGSNYFYKIEVIDSEDGTPEGPRGSWSSVTAPTISSATDNGLGQIEVKVNALVGHDGGDELLVHLYNGDELVATKGSVTEKGQHNILFTPADSGSYTVKTELLRAGEATKSGNTANVDFTYILAAPYISSVTSAGGGSIEVKWTHVHEAEGYIVYQNGSEIARLEAGYLSYLAKDLTIGNEYSYVVSAIRGSEEKKSAPLSTTATEEAKMAWSFSVYGPSTNTTNNGYIGSINDDGKVTVYSEGGSGKIQPKSTDGLAFYYTAIPTEYNFTFRAKVTVDSWTFSNGQEGFGLLATDRVGENGNKNGIWSNQYMVGSTKIEYWYNHETEKLADETTKAGTKYTMKLGIGTIAKTGITKDTIDDITAGDVRAFKSLMSTLETSAAQYSSEDKLTYNIIGNNKNDLTGTIVNEAYVVTEMILEIQKNNSGYFLSYYDTEGNLLMTKKHYGADSLNQLDEDFVYVGFFASRNARATFSDMELTTILASEDAPAEVPPTTYITPLISIGSPESTTSKDYTLIVDPNVDGRLEVTYRGEKIVNAKLTGLVRFKHSFELKDYGDNTIKIQFFPDPYQLLPEFTELANTRTITRTIDISYNKGNYHRKTIYISPDALPDNPLANGTKEYPFDLATAVQNACPGQTLILMEGRYLMESSFTIARGNNGTAKNPIRLIADPEAETRPVIDFQKLYSGLTHGGDYWYFYGFDVTGSSNGNKGFQVSGNYNVLDQIRTYENGNTGIQISRFNNNDLFEDWPSYNLILNCESFNNFDSGFEDADGFAAKLTVGEGNVFDGCVAYNNADDGWDLYAKVETGAIGSVTIQNCVAYNNGFVSLPGYEGKTGNGNGFKMGGESISGKHVLKNSIAFDNLQKGIDSNSCPDIIVINSVSFNNGSHNVALYTNNVPNTDYSANGVVSFRTKGLDVAENLKGKGTQDTSKYRNESTYYWNPGSNQCANSLGEVITADMFESLEFTGWTRNEDGSLNLNGFLKLKDNAPNAAKQCYIGGKASYDIELLPDEDCSYVHGWSNHDPNGHWRLCECGNKSNIGEHTLIWINEEEATPDKPGRRHRYCTTCEYEGISVPYYVDNPTPPAGDGNTDNQPDDPTEPAPQMGFFEMIWQWILDLLRSIFPGLFPEESEQSFVPYHRNW